MTTSSQHYNNPRQCLTLRRLLTLVLAICILLTALIVLRVQLLLWERQHDGADIEIIHQVNYQALGPWGEPGYVADPEALHKARYEILRNDPSLTDLDLLQTFHPEHLQQPFHAGDVCGAGGRQYPVHPEGFKLLTEKIQIDHTHQFYGARRKHRILCGMYTYDGNRDLARAAAITWGYKCDGFISFSTATVPQLGMINLKHDGPEMYENMWQKIRSIWAYIHDHYKDEYDYFHLGGDDVLLLVENLRRFLVQYEQHNDPNKPIFLGQLRGAGNHATGVMGGAGYTLNRVALDKLLTEVLTDCKVDVQNAAEDLNISFCFKRKGILPGETRDLETAEQTFHCKSPKQVYLAHADASNGGFPVVKDWWERQPHPTKTGQLVGKKDGLDAAATYSVAFHNLKTPLYIARVHAILYGTCPKGTPMAESIRQAKVALAK